MTVLQEVQDGGRDSHVRRTAGLAYNSCSASICWMDGEWMDDDDDQTDGYADHRECDR